VRIKLGASYVGVDLRRGCARSPAGAGKIVEDPILSATRAALPDWMAVLVQAHIGLSSAARSAP
jgi:hypothetical protein